MFSLHVFFLSNKHDFFYKLNKRYIETRQSIHNFVVVFLWTVKVEIYNDCLFFYIKRWISVYMIDIHKWICPLNEIKLYLMLRSQIKLTSYDFSDVHITGEFDNRPGTGRFLKIFSGVVTYRTGAVRRLYMKTSAGHRTTSYGARPAL